MPDTSTCLASPTRVDVEALPRVYARLAPAVAVWCEMQVRPGVRPLIDPEDLSQEVWLRVCRELSRFDPARGAFRAWVFGIARRVVLEALRRAMAATVSPGGSSSQLRGVRDPATTMLRALMRQDDVRRLWATVAQLDEESRTLFLYRGLEGLPHAVVGKRLGISGDAVEIRWRRLRERLRRELGPTWSVAAVDGDGS